MSKQTENHNDNVHTRNHSEGYHILSQAESAAGVTDQLFW